MDSQTSHARDLKKWNQQLQVDPNYSAAYVQRGMVYFKLGKIEESIQDFDRAEQLDPGLTPYLWQRGLSLYYADRFAAAVNQFEIDLTVNAQDVEETVWRYLCIARLRNVTEAQNSLQVVRTDPRPVMRQVYELYAGNTSPEEVLEGWESARDRFYSSLYVGLYYEATGDQEQSRSHIAQAVQVFETEYKNNDYMGYLAIVHQQLRGWSTRS
jgi:tetratricopeptide (TPR) repeat protein